MIVNTAIATAISHGKTIVYRFPSLHPYGPSWEGRDNPIHTTTLGEPITDIDYWQGRYVWCPLTLRTEDGRELVLPDAVVALTRAKQIITTQVVGMTGTIKEYISAGDYDLNISVGIAAKEGSYITDRYPDEELRLLRELLDMDRPMTVQSAFLDIFEVDRIVVKSYSLTQQTDSNYQELAISALSDDEYNVYSTDY